jgi:prevent-host-death family protein
LLAFAFKVITVIRIIIFKYAQKTVIAREAKTHFGDLLDTMQCEPVMVTKNNRPVGIMISIKDAADTLIPDLFMEKEERYDEWFTSKVAARLAQRREGSSTLKDHDLIMDCVWARVVARTQTP